MMNLVFMGTPDFASGILQRLLDAGYNVTGVVTQPDKPRGRKKIVTPGPVSQIAQDHHIPLYQPARIRKNPEAFQKISDMKPDLVVVAAFGQIIPKEILDLPKYGCINVHASLLPAYRGASPIQHVILDGCKETGVTIMQMGEGLDTGDMISQAKIPISDDDTAGSLFDKLTDLGADLLLKTIPTIEDGTATRTPQPEESTTPYARMIKKEDGHVNWSKDAETLERLVRGMNPWPSAFTSVDGKMLKIWRAHVEPSDSNYPAGTLLGDIKKELKVATGKGVLVLDEVQLAGKKRMETEAFLRGFHIQKAVLQ